MAVVLTLITSLAPPAGALSSAPTERAAIGRLYFAAFDRPADAAGLDYWHAALRQGIDLNSIAGYFVRSEEFQVTYGNVDNEALVTLIYNNVLDRAPDPEGLAYWVGLLDDGHRPGTILNGFAQSAEFISNQEPSEPAHILMLGDSIFHGIRLLEIPVADASMTFMTEEGRQASTLPTLIHTSITNGSLADADLVVIHLGTNGWSPEYPAMFDQQLAILAPKPVLIVNTEVARPWESAANDALAAIAARNPNATLVNWNAAVATHPEWMRADGVHPNSEGLKALAGLIEGAASGIY
ncbi:MAG: DUF4214 domain-containing protein [Acidimicrobiales bacterium]